jgi:hypothetical protein
VRAKCALAAARRAKGLLPSISSENRFRRAFALSFDFALLAICCERPLGVFSRKCDAFRQKAPTRPLRSAHIGATGAVGDRRQRSARSRPS